MDKKGKVMKLFYDIQKIWKSFKRSYLYKLVTRFLSTVCSIILVILLIVGAMMFYFNTKIKAYEKKGLEYTAPFGLYTIISGSMEPNVDIYDVVIAVDQDVSKIKVGDIITFISTWEVNFGYTVTHRVVGIAKTENGEIQLTTKGDNNQSADGGVVTQKNLVGKVVGRLPQLGRLQFFLATKMGWFLVVFIPAVIIIIVDAMKIFKLYVLKGQIDNVKTTKEAEKLVDKKNIDDGRPRLKLDDIEELQPSQALKLKIEDLDKVQPKEEVKLKIDDIDKVIVPEPVKIAEKIESDANEWVVPKDENIDTVELPKVGEDGIIKENTSELPTVASNEYHSGHTEVISIVHADLSEENEVDEDTIAMPALKGEKVSTGKIEMPVLKKANENGTSDEIELPMRKELKRRN